MQDLLPTTTFDDEHLRTHLKAHKWTSYGRQILEPLFSDGRLKNPTLFPTGTKVNEDGSHYSLYQVFDVGTDGSPLPLHGDKAGPRMPKGQSMWHYMKVRSCSLHSLLETHDD